MAGTLTVDQLKASTGVLATQNGMNGIAKAWIQFAGSGTITSSFNVSSLTYTTTANYTVNFTTPMPSNTYAYALGFGTNDLTSADVFGARCSVASQTTTSHYFRVLYSGASGSAYGAPTQVSYIAFSA